MKESPLLSIFIPTRNRKENVSAIINAHIDLLAMENIEIVIQDCSDTKDDSQYLSLNNRIRYIHSNPCSMTENWNRGISCCHGKYVICIGDDDFVLPDAIKIAEWASENGLDAVTSKRQPQYFWMNYPDSSYQGRLVLSLYTHETIYPDAEKVLRECIPEPVVNYSLMPSVYHGIVSRKLLCKVKESLGHVFSTTCPDYYFSIASLVFVDKYAVLDSPFTINGHSGISNSATGVKSKGKIASYFTEYSNYNWGPLVPVVARRSAVAIFLDAKYHALRNLGLEKELKHVNIAYTYSEMLISESKKAFMLIVAQYFRASKIIGIQFDKAIRMLIGNLIRAVCCRINSKFKQKSTPVNRIFKLHNIKEAALRISAEKDGETL